MRSITDRRNKDDEDILEAMERLRKASQVESPRSDPDRFDVGTVVVGEVVDFRFGSAVSLDRFNSCGLLILQRSLELLRHQKQTPTYLALPAGIFRARLKGQAAEGQASTKLRSVLAGAETIADSLKALSQFGLTGVILGIDDEAMGPQVPVVLDAQSGSVRSLARRADTAPREMNDEFRTTRSLPGSPTIYVAYCGEIAMTEAGGIVEGFTLGSGTPPDWVIDLSHLFRAQWMSKRHHRTNLSGIANFVLKSCGNRTSASRLDAPVVASTVLVNRRPCLDRSIRSALWLSARRRADRSGNGRSRYLPPSRILALADDSGHAALCINLFKSAQGPR